MLLPVLLNLFATWADSFPQRRTWERAVQHALGSLACLGRHCVSRILWTNGRQQRSWSADYFFYSRSPWDPQQLFLPLRRQALPYCGGRYLGMAVDDTRLRKTGRCIPHVSYHRDPLSPPFHVNFMLGLRFLQTSLLLPLHRRAPASARALPIRFEEVPVLKKPRKHASAELWKQYQLARKLHNLSTRFVQTMKILRVTLDQAGGQKKVLVLAVDASFSNRTVWGTSVPGVELIARTRKDAVLCFPATPETRCFYAAEKFTPEQVRHDDRRAWQNTRICYGGKRRLIRYKEVPSVLWQGGAKRRLLRLFVIAPTPYRKHRKGGGFDYRQPAYLLTSLAQGATRTLLQIYFDRWQIEVNHREEKDTLGVGQAQLWNPLSVPKQPAFAVATYSALLLAGLKAFGPTRGPAFAQLPKWRRDAKRPSALDLITLLRKEMVEHPELLAPFDLNPTDRGLTAAAAA
jgi:hypothetical protein